MLKTYMKFFESGLIKNINIKPLLNGIIKITWDKILQVLNKSRYFNLTYKFKRLWWEEKVGDLSDKMLSLFIIIGGLCFLTVGVITFIKQNFEDSYQIIPFFPQGMILIFYGTIGILLGIFQNLTMWWNIGWGFYELDNVSKEIFIYRQSYPGKNEEIYLTFFFKDLNYLKVLIVLREDLTPVNSQKQLLLYLKDNRKIPILTEFVKKISFKEFDYQTVVISRYLKIPITLATK
uniref:Photosystem I assembly protein Ycf4 n=1 Tax=Karlodinium veneficum TaxID=407301 RepID=G1E796_KARVE|nr:hypothetical chloroplast RF4 [Karlodinium veneficum]